MGVFRLYREQVIPAGLAETWDFISSPRNLSKITPEYMRFEVTSQKLPEKMEFLRSHQREIRNPPHQTYRVTRQLEPL